MTQNLNAYPILKGTRGQSGIPLEKLAELICKISHLLQIAPQIDIIDINPLITHVHEIVTVDIRIKINCH